MGAAVRMNRPIHKSVFDAAKEIGERELKVLKALDKARPQAVRSSDLMQMVDLKWDYLPGYWHNNSMEFDRFVKFANVLVHVDHLLRRSGWQMCRTGGTPRDEIWISEQSGSPG